MKAKVEKAILNNNDLYEAIFNPQLIKSNRNNSIWYCLEKTPPLYSNLVTVSENWRPDEIFKKISTNFKKEKWDEWSIKDSFGTLDLSEYGFKKLFDAQWLYLETAEFTPVKTDKKLKYEIVKSEDILANWRISWDQDEQLGKQIFHPELLNNPKVCFIAGYDGEKIVNGCFINKTEDVLGISNFFAPDKNIEFWSDMINFVFDSIAFADIVGYQQKDIVKNLQQLSFEATGDLTVWLNKSIP